MNDRPYVANDFVVAKRWSKNLNIDLYRCIFTQSSREFTVNMDELRRLAEVLDDVIAQHDK
ncbi:hypothetical protein [Rhodococcus wratislaviensis]|uniref:Uncharacterized protein n=1 Tax=Rhodococcus wratislaviensis NBRC 100605 TaxID=1219028 RepID=X0R8Q8_RHOWR|nr:hypothetical protein [Rhodococcus wratislaviensis]GAF47385.1 hypothetical protein RW1_040_00470 [Rhodococcus wratislaviensis NBRC 100605]